MKKNKYPRGCPKCGCRDVDVEWVDEDEVAKKECHCEQCSTVFNVYYEFLEWEIEE